MNYRLSIHIFAALVIGIYSLTVQNTPTPIHQYKIQNSLKDSPLREALVLGQKDNLKPKTKRSLKALNIMHLITPSGLHLTILLGVFRNIKYRSIKLLINLATVLMAFSFFPALHALKRMAILKLLSELSSKISFTKVFYFYFCIDFIFKITFGNSPLSYSLSFLFIGSLLLSQNIKEGLIALLLSQVIAQYYLKQDIYPLGLILGNIITFLTVPLLPLLMGLGALEILFIKPFLSNLWMAITHFLDWIYPMLKMTPNMSPNLFFIVIMLLALSLKKKWILISLLFLTTDIRNFHLKSDYRYKRHISIKKDEILYQKPLKRGTKLYTRDGKECLILLYPFSHSGHCK